MTETEKQYFLALNKDRSESADMLEKPSMSGIQRSVVEKYTDQAHFIYELLQNADDVGAASADFTLHPDRLVFKHNGTRHFDVTDPSKEKEDTENGHLGDLNAITSVANSNKQKALIGKFGVGFKAVFQYTNTPHIYDPDVRFKIERFIVPIELKDDYVGRLKEETVFVFPFDHPVRGAEEAYEDIADKLRSLVYPILFLKHLKNISFEIDDGIGLYGKDALVTKKFHDVTAQKLSLEKNEGEDFVSEYLWLFSRKDENERDYSVGFFVDEENKLIPVNMPAFCFFPTKEVTNLSFIVHAPFLLTDSREGIKAGESYNKEMVRVLAQLAAEGLEYLKIIGEEIGTRIIDDSILDIVPINEDAFAVLNNKSKISFLPFFTELQKALAGGLLPTTTGYTSEENAYWSDTIEINGLFSDEQLGQLLDKKEAQWVFKSYGRNTTGHNAREGLQEYIDSLTNDWINESRIFSNMTSWFISQQTEAWLHVFYEWSGNFRRFQSMRYKPIFLDESGKPTAAYDKNDERTLFLPSIAVIECPTVKQSLLDNEKTREFLLHTVKLVEPSLRDYIYNTIIPQYKNDGDIDTDPHFALFFKYYCECKHEEAADFLSKIKALEFLTYYEPDDKQSYRGRASDLYFPTQELVAYFETRTKTKFVALSEYEKEYATDESKRSLLYDFLSELGIKKHISTISTELTWTEANKLPYIWHRSTGGNSWREIAPEGVAEILPEIVKNSDEKKSCLLWAALCDILSSSTDFYTRYYGLSYFFSGSHSYYYYSPKSESYTTELTKKIKNEKWILNKDGIFCAPADLNAEELPNSYDSSSEPAKKLMQFLGIASVSEDKEDHVESDDNLTDEQRDDLAFAQRMREAGLDDTDTFEEFMEFKRLKDKKEQRGSGHKPEDNDDDDAGDTEENPDRDRITTIVDDLRKRTQQRSKNIGAGDSQKGPVPPSEEASEEDVDEHNPSLVDYQKQIERKKEQSTEEIECIAIMQELQETALSAERYSYLWFKTLLEMEILNSDQDSINSREVSISFGKIEREPGTLKTFILKQPSKYIPQYMEDLADIPLVLHMFDGTTKTVAIEVSSVKSYTLHVKLRKNAELNNVDLNCVREVTIKAAKPVFLLEKLQEGLQSLELDDDYSMKDNLPSNLEFVFGPPGTGKTTYLANNVLIPFMKEWQDMKVLVLTPTNKAADVITSKVMEAMGDDRSYENWLVRFGITGSEEIESSPIYRDKTFDIRNLPRSVAITTIARFPYDFFMPAGERLHLHNLNWDYIVIDEASMIPIADIIYPIYKKTPKKFIIAGDPFQIEPITTVDLWTDENVYTLVNLKSFVNPKTEPMQYEVITLTTQYRSIPEIGTVFSQFAYGGILQHHRKPESERDLHLDKYLKVEPLNIVKFPVSKYESIYKAKRLKGTTPYQVYSAIFTMEFVSYIAEKLEENNPGETFRIGVIAPYKAQASLIDKLMVSAKLPRSTDVQVGTIHGFQGDECDIVMAVLNPPPGISSSNRLFLNKQNILNVAISRARDYLFLIMPDDNTDKVSNLKKVKQIERLIRMSGAFVEYDSPKLEAVMFESSTYIEDNSFATSHQTVNVYGQPEMKYEIRSEDSAVDVQVHRV